MPEDELPPGCGGANVDVGMKVALGLVFAVGVVPFDGHANRVLAGAIPDRMFPDREWLLNDELPPFSIGVVG